MPAQAAFEAVPERPFMVSLSLRLPQPLCSTIVWVPILRADCARMASGEAISGLESRYALYGLDAPARRSIKLLWPTIAPHLDASRKKAAPKPKRASGVARGSMKKKVRHMVKGQAKW